jgi:hypothetical protein
MNNLLRGRHDGILSSFGLAQVNDIKKASKGLSQPKPELFWRTQAGITTQNQKFPFFKLQLV